MECITIVIILRCNAVTYFIEISGAVRRMVDKALFIGMRVNKYEDSREPSKVPGGLNLPN